MKITHILSLLALMAIPVATQGMAGETSPDTKAAKLQELTAIKILLQQQQARANAAKTNGILWGLLNLGLAGGAGYLAYKKGFELYQYHNRTGSGIANAFNNLAAEASGTHNHRDRFFFNHYLITGGLAALAVILGTTGWNQIAQSEMIP